MPKKLDRKPPVRIVAELLPPRPHTSDNNLDDLARLVEEKVREILADRDDFLMQPFFASRNVTREMRRLQTVPEQRKWSVYFDRWGCLICHKKLVVYGGCGMCGTCRQRTISRLEALLRELLRERVRAPRLPDRARDLEKLAKRALAKAVPRKEQQKALPENRVMHLRAKGELS